MVTVVDEGGEITKPACIPCRDEIVSRSKATSKPPVSSEKDIVAQIEKTRRELKVVSADLDDIFNEVHDAMIQFGEAVQRWLESDGGKRFQALLNHYTTK